MKKVCGITFYPRQSAMHGAVEFHTRWGWVVIQPPLWSFGTFRRPWVYISPDATPSAKTWSLGLRYRDW